MQTHASENAAELRTIVILGVAALCVALNVGLGSVVSLLKLPVYLDACGTIVCALLAGALGARGFVLAAVVGAASFTVTGLLFNPAVLWFIPTQIAIAAYSFYVARPVLGRYLPDGRHTIKGWAILVACGVGLGLVAGIVSAPIITYVFGGITGSGVSLVVAVMLKSGATLYKSVLASGLAAEPIDKTLQMIAAVALLRSTPSRVRNLFQ